VGVVILPVEGKGVLLIQRNVPDGKGKWALPGGYLETGESWQEGSARELGEETGIQVAASDLHLYDLISTPDGRFLLIVSIGPQISEAEVPSISPEPEVSGFMVATSPTELAFSIHSRVLERFLTLRLE
jgi:ADP-ribose pyrophosphatase YjhB (NUDIX family)